MPTLQRLGLGPPSGRIESALKPQPTGTFPDLSPHSLINADFCVGSVCVAFGAILGKVSPMQLLVMTLFQVTLFSVNEFILLSLLEVSRDQNGGDDGVDTWGSRGIGKEGWGDVPAGFNSTSASDLTF